MYSHDFTHSQYVELRLDLTLCEDQNIKKSIVITTVSSDNARGIWFIQSDTAQSDSTDSAPTLIFF